MRFYLRLTLCIFIFPTVSFGTEVFRGPISSALGGTGRAGLNSSEAAFVNPASIILVKDHQFDAFFRDGDIDQGQHRNGWALGAVDNSEEVWMPGSLHYARLRDTGLSIHPVNRELWHGALGYMVSNRLAIGLSGYRLQDRVSGLPDYIQWNYSLGALVLVTEDLSVGYVLSDISQPGGETPIGLRQDMQQGIGLFYRAVNILTLRFDVSRNERFNPEKKLTYMVGMETANTQWFVVRLGHRRDELRDQTIWTAGLGFNGPRLKVDYSVEKNQERTSGALHSVDIRVPF